MANALTGSTVYINNELVEYIPNTLVFDDGTPERTVTSQVVGNGSVTNVSTEDFTTAKSKFMLALKTTSQNIEMVRDWVDIFDLNTIRIVSREGVSHIISHSTIINKPEYDTGVDGNISLEFEGDPVVSG